MDKQIIEKKIIETDLNISTINYIKLIIYILQELNDKFKFKYISDEEKKRLIKKILLEFINDGDNIFCKNNNHQLIYSLTNLNNKTNLDDAIYIIITCINDSNNIIKKNKKCFFCFF